MKIVRIDRLQIDNFKGISRLDLNFSGDSAKIYGDNATGKTTIYDALTWLLFGKDSHGNAKFDIKPLDKRGEVLAGAMPTVTGVIDINGKNVTLRKILREKWEKHRGGEERYGGNTVDYYIDDVPVKERQYKSEIETLVAPEDVFRMLTNTYLFCRDMSWKDRRKVLFDLAGTITDDQLLAEPGFDGLRDELNGRKMDDFRAMLAQQRKDANSKLNLIPARMDELEKQMADLPESFDPAARDEIIVNVEAQREKIASMHGDTLRQNIKNEIDDLRIKQRALQLDNKQHRNSQIIPTTDDRTAIRQEIDRIRARIDIMTGDIEKLDASSKVQEMQLADFRDRWKSANNEEFKDGICHYCGQPLPAERAEEMRNKFNADKKRRKEELVTDSENIKIIIADNKKSIEDLRDNIRSQNALLSDKKDQLIHIPAQENVEITDLPHYAEDLQDLQDQIDKKNATLESIDADNASVTTEINEDIRALNLLRAEQDEIASKVKLRESLSDRVKELQSERKAKAAAVERIDDLIDQCEQFVQIKVERVSGAVNAKFSICTWRLFTEAINGNLQDCCDAIIDGVPYGGINSAMQINAGMDVIDALSDYYQISVPLFVDNAESITALRHADTQVIRLVVSEQDKELRCEA